MTFDKITADLFDKTMSKWEEDDPQCQAESLACSDLVEESRLAGLLAKQALQLMAGAPNVGMQRRVMAGIFGYGLRYGWHLRRLLHEREELRGLMTEADYAALRKEIQESV